MTELKGYVDHIIYRNAENGYTVLVLNVDDVEKTLTGVFRNIEVGEMIRVTGEETHHASYGDQFRVQNYEIVEPEDIVSIERYLSSGAIKGVGPTMARRIVKAFGEDSLRVMDEEPERLIEIKGISERIARNIAQQMQEKRGMRKAMMHLQDLGISLNLSIKIYAQYENKVFDILRKNPYRLVDDIPGVGFKTADDIAQKSGFGTHSPFRIRSGILYVLSAASGEGHVYLPASVLKERAAALLEVDRADTEAELDNLIIDGKLISDTSEDGENIFLTLGYYVELDSARRLEILDKSCGGSAQNVEKDIASIAKKSGLELDDKQRDAVVMAATRGVSVITGGPGTGKTTIIKILLEYFDRIGIDVLLAAPTGRAAKRMSEATGYEARTIHRMLEVGGEQTGAFGRDEDEPLDAGAVIIDEMSMVDIYLFHALLKAISPGTRLIMVGDASQLPSVGPGTVLKDIIESNRFGVAVLDRIFRQAALSDIVVNAHKINLGEDISLNNDSKDFFFLGRDDASVIIEGIVYLVTKKLPPYVAAKPFDIQVMTPMRKGILGVENLNKVLQERLNPPGSDKGEIASGDGVIRLGDKVMQIKNNYQLEWEITGKYNLVLDRGQGIFNGDMGTVVAVDKSAGTLKVEFDDRRCVTYGLAQLDELELAYAITIHKSQGSEYPAVVLPLLSGPAMLMSRNLLYTAVTRARQCVTIIGSAAAVKSMIANEHQQVRYTALARRITEVCESD